VRPEITDVVYPPSSKLGLIPLDGMSVSEETRGLFDCGAHVVISIKRYDRDAFQNMKRLRAFKGSVNESRQEVTIDGD
jgi:hypothetical protein